MSNQQAIASLRTLCHNCELFPKCVHEKPECFQAIELAISALQAQEAKTQLSAEGTTSDLISRRVAVDALWEIRQKEISDGRRFHDYCSLSTAVDVIKDLPSAQPEPCEDAISRQAAIALANSLKDDLPDDERIADTVMAHNEGILEYQTKLSLLPSAQPEIEERTEEFAQNVPKEDLISRKVAIDAINKALDRETLLNSFVRKVAVDALKTMPSAEPEIVRCKDCQHFRTYYHGTESDPVITHACVWFLDREMGLEDYCSKGVFR